VYVSSTIAVRGRISVIHRYRISGQRRVIYDAFLFRGAATTLAPCRREHFSHLNVSKAIIVVIRPATVVAMATF
jgi:hypothetical protein